MNKREKMMRLGMKLISKGEGELDRRQFAILLNEKNICNVAATPGEEDLFIQVCNDLEY